jgi:hypothetical protein
MPPDTTLDVVIGDEVVHCNNVDDKMRLEPVGGILSDGSVEGYSPEELDAMVATLSQYDQPAALERLKKLVAKHR